VTPEPRVLTWDAQLVADSLHIGVTAAIEHFRDGRMNGRLIDIRLAIELHADMVDTDGGGLGLVLADGTRARVRRLTDGGVYFGPQSMIGTGRRYDEADYRRFLTTFDVFAVADVTGWPNVPVAWVTTAQVGSWLTVREGRLGAAVARELLFPDPNQPRLWT
jgi:hypothetical protein